MTDGFEHWLAGFIDGEGCFTIVHQSRSATALEWQKMLPRRTGNDYTELRRRRLELLAIRHDADARVQLLREASS